MFDILPEEGITIKVDGKNPLIEGLSIDSRKVKKGYLFIALKGIQTDGHNHISSAIKNGAVAILVEELPESMVEGIAFVRYLDRKTIAGEVSKKYYDDPSSQLKLIGITGTNGKSSCVTMLYNLFNGMGYKCGMISTIEVKIGDMIIPATHTTPDSITVHKLLGDMVTDGCDYAFMEVSSHALDQGRIHGLVFSGGVFTNITHDHLDYHGNMLNYINAKKSFFDGLPSEAFAIANIDDKNGKIMLQNTTARKKYFGLQHPCDYKGKILSNTIEGLYLDINGIKVHFNLIGKFNASNLLVVYAVASELGFENEEMVTHMSMLSNAEGRFEKIIGNNKGITGIVDYAHTPDALQNVLETINEVKDRNSKTLTVFGCGGDRDKGKRPEMAKVACLLSDSIIITNDNPRNEDPEDILDDIEAGIPKDNKDSTLRIASRKDAIRTACRLAENNDIILVAGKGHEKYQEIKGKKFPFDDKEILIAELLKDI